MMDLLTFAVTTGSMSVLLATGDVFEPIKYWIITKTPKSMEEMISTFLFCPMCIGFWVGLLLSIVSDINIGMRITGITYLLMGSVTAISGTLINRILEKLRDNK